jgi:Catalase
MAGVWLRRSAFWGLSVFAILDSGISSQAQDLEKQPQGEEASIAEVRARALLELKGRYPEGTPVLVRRDAHAKPHGCVKGVFTVDTDIPVELRVGTFSEPGQRFEVLIRYSNGAFEPGADTGLDGRGMAVKIIDAEPGIGAQTRTHPPHDILMINYPVFFSPNVTDYKDFASAGALTGNSDGLKRYFLPSYNPMHWRVRQAFVAYKIASQKASSPLSLQYYSMAPFLFGAGRAVKYSARPCSAPGPTDLPVSDKPNFLRDALWKGLASGPACFELLVQERKADMDIENTLVEWPEAISPFRRVGKIDVLAGQTTTDMREQACESLVFNPWNAPAEQRPLGGINRLRRAVYEGISSYRTSRNGVTIADPATLWNRF